MLAVKARYDNGVVHWLQQPPVGDHYSLTVVFEEMEQPQTEAEMKQERKKEAINALCGFCSNVPADVSMVDQLIAERRLEAQREA